jgi:hypothetical protein
MRSLTNVWIVVESWHSMARAILIYMSYVKDVMRDSIMTKSLVVNQCLKKLNGKMPNMIRSNDTSTTNYAHLDVLADTQCVEDHLSVETLALLISPF